MVLGSYTVQGCIGAASSGFIFKNDCLSIVYLQIQERICYQVQSKGAWAQTDQNSGRAEEIPFRKNIAESNLNERCAGVRKNHGIELHAVKTSQMNAVAKTLVNTLNCCE